MCKDFQKSGLNSHTFSYDETEWIVTGLGFFKDGSNGVRNQGYKEAEFRHIILKIEK